MFQLVDVKLGAENAEDQRLERSCTSLAYVVSNIFSPFMQGEGMAPHAAACAGAAPFTDSDELQVAVDLAWPWMMQPSFSISWKNVETCKTALD